MTMKTKSVMCTLMVGILARITVMASITTECDLTGEWTYDPEPETRYAWVDVEGSIGCFAGTDFWKEATAKINGSAFTVTFMDQSCPGVPKGTPIVKNGEIGTDCMKIVMNDTQPNCPNQGDCSYSRARPLPPPPPPCNSSSTVMLDVEWLKCRTQAIIAGCVEAIKPNSPLNKNINATWAYTPDATHSYGAQWTRDFAYTVMGASELMDPQSVQQSVMYTFAGQRSDGCMPDRVQIDGMSVMSPGPMLPNNGRNPQHDHAWDNGPFACLLLAAAAKAWPDTEFFCKLEPQARRALDFVNRSSSYLVYNDANYPNATYGFTDTVAKTGHLLFTSLVYIDASRQLAQLSKLHGCGNATRYISEAEDMSTMIDTMKDPAGPLWLAATVDNEFPDVWGSAYLVALNLSTPVNRQAAMDELVANVNNKYFRDGQVRSLPDPLYWDRCCWTPGCGDIGTGCPAHGTYQNGAFWATPLSYITQAMINTNHTQFAKNLLAACINDFKNYGIYENVDRGFPAESVGVLNYTASATNVLWGAQLLEADLAQQ